MAATSASRSWARRALTTGVIAAVGLIALAIPASAHVSDAFAKCGGKDDKVAQVHVNASLFASKGDDDKPNKLTIIEVLKSGEQKTLHELMFGAKLEPDQQDFTVGDSAVTHDIIVKIVAADDSKFNNTIKLKTKICDKQTPPTSPSSSSSAVPPAPQPAPAPPAVGANGQLASTGASIGLPLAVGALLLLAAACCCW